MSAQHLLLYQHLIYTRAEKHAESFGSELTQELSKAWNTQKRLNTTHRNDNSETQKR